MSVSRLAPPSSRSLAVACALALAGCSSNDPASGGAGKVVFATYGEDFIEQEIPPTRDGEVVVVDGWAIKYSKFLLVLRNVRVASGAASGLEIGGATSGSQLFDMTRPGPKLVAELSGLAAKTWEHVSFEIGPVASDTTVAAGTDSDKARMLKDGYSIYIAGEGRRGGVVKSFEWGFTTNTLYERCRGSLNGKDTEGVVVTNGGTDHVELTIHGDHFFYDNLQADDAKVRFGNVAASDIDGDGAVTLAELEAKRLVDIPKSEGDYGTGGAGGINHLRAFVTALSRTIGHFRGEGECSVRPL